MQEISSSTQSTANRKLEYLPLISHIHFFTSREVILWQRPLTCRKSIPNAHTRKRGPHPLHPPGWPSADILSVGTAPGPPHPRIASSNAEPDCAESPICDACGEANETVTHFIDHLRVPGAYERTAAITKSRREEVDQQGVSPGRQEGRHGTDGVRTGNGAYALGTAGRRRWKTGGLEWGREGGRRRRWG